MRLLHLGLAILLGAVSGCFPDPEPGVEVTVDQAVEAAAEPIAEWPPPRPTLVVLISIDTLRADRLGLYGHDRFTSPVLDAFAAEGTVFEDASAPAPWTLPSHASMLTGLNPLGHGVVTPQNALPDEVPTLAGLFARAGFATAAVVNSTWLKPDTFRVTRDFDTFLAVDDADYGRRTPATWVTDQAMEWVRDRAGEPLFLFVHYYDVHADYASLPAFEKLFVTPYDGPADGTGWQLQVENFDDRHIALCITAFDPEICTFGSREKPRVIGAQTRKVGFDAADVRHLEELYDAGVRQLDSELQRFFSFLDDQGLRDTALVVVTADHGEEFMDHGRVEHFLTTYQEMLHVPLIVRGPGVPAGLRVDAPVSLIDIAPTLLSRVGARVPDTLEGIDLSPLLDGAEAGEFAERPIFGEAAGGEGYSPALAAIYPLHRSVRQGRFKLIQDARAGQTALYDLEADPDERNDISLQEPERASRLEALLVARHAEAAERRPGVEAVELDAEELDRLRALGYVP